MKRVIVVGSRGVTDFNYIAEILDALFFQDERFKNEEIIVLTGTETGVNTLAQNYAFNRGLNHKGFEADWKSGEDAGDIRNAKMCEIADFAVVFWDGVSKTSKNIIDTMNRLGKSIEVINCELPLIFGKRTLVENTKPILGISTAGTFKGKVRGYAPHDTFKVEFDVEGTKITAYCKQDEIRRAVV